MGTLCQCHTSHSTYEARCFTLIHNHGERMVEEVVTSLRTGRDKMKHKEIPELQMKQNLLGKIAQLFVDRYQLTLLLILMITTLGLLSIVALPKESFPEIVFPTITVQTIYPGASPVDVEALVTDKIEAKLAGVDDLDTMSSQSNF